MSSLLAPRPPGWRMREDDGQGALFGGEALAPPTPTPTPFPPRERSVAPREVAVPTEVEAPAQFAVPAEVAAPADNDALVHDAAGDAPPLEARDARDLRVPRALGAPLAGPTLDDAVSRSWEGLVAGVPAACPVCHAEVVPASGAAIVGHCGTCHVTLD